MTFDAQLTLSDIPSRRRDLLRVLKGATVNRMVRCCWEPPEQIAARWGRPSSMVFSRTYGPLLITLDSGLVLGFANRDALISVTVWLERDDSGRVARADAVLGDPDLHPLDATDPPFSTPELRWFVGRRIRDVRVLKIEAFRPKAADRPREAGVVLDFGDGHELVLSHQLDHGDFSVLLRSEIAPDILEDLRELTLEESAKEPPPDYEWDPE